jgi:hypothetical protein
MPPAGRKYHRKSKAGCAECKRRHIKASHTDPFGISTTAIQYHDIVYCPSGSCKQYGSSFMLYANHVQCDERRPVCVNCATSQAQCPYKNDLGRTDIGRQETQASPSALQDHSSTVAAYMDLWPPTASPSVDLNMLHLELFNQFTSSTCASFVRTAEDVSIYRQSIVDCAFAHPYLMYEILAFSALHLSITRPARRAFYQQVATTLQAQSLSSLDDTLANVDENNCLPVLFFSHIIGVHSFCDTIALCNEPFSRFHKHLIATINLLRGVQAVILPWWSVLSKMELGKVMLAADRRRADVKKSFQETDQLRDLIKSAEINESTAKVYEDALMRLQRDFDEVQETDEPLATTNTAFSWLVTSSTEYTKLLDEQRPEALMLLSYYTVVLHRRRKSWIVGDAESPYSM